MDPLITTAIITGILAVFTMMFKSVRSSDCFKTNNGVCCECDTRSRSSSSNLETVIRSPPPSPVIEHKPVVNESHI